MRRSLAALSTAVALALPASVRAQERQPSAWLSFSYSAFPSYFDGGGRRRPLEDAFGDPVTGSEAHDVRLDAAVLTFAGRMPIARGLSVALSAPLVAVDRTGTRSIAGLTAEDLYAHAIAAGDLRGELRARVVGQSDGYVDARVIAQLPSGTWRNLGPDELPTGGGVVGLGGEVVAYGRGSRADASIAAGTMAFLPRTVGTDVDRGAAQWIDARIGIAAPHARVGIAIEELARAGDRRGHDRIAALEDGGEPGALAPPSWLLSAGLYSAVPVGDRDSLEVSLLGPADGWLFVPAETGLAIAGRNVLASALTIRIAYRTRF